MIYLSLETTNVRAVVQIGRVERMGVEVVDWDKIAEEKAAERQRIRSDQESAQQARERFAKLVRVFTDELFGAIEAEIITRNKAIRLPSEHVKISRSDWRMDCTKVKPSYALLTVTVDRPSELTNTSSLKIGVVGFDASGQRETIDSEYLIEAGGVDVVVARSLRDSSYESTAQITQKALTNFAYFAA